MFKRGIKLRKESKVRTMSSDELTTLVSNSLSYIEVLNKLGYKRSGRLQSILRKRIEDEGISISHFRNWGQINRMSLDEILVEDSTYNNQLLKERLVKEGILEYKCVECGNLGEWNGNPLVLQLDHINGNPKDNRLENLRFLCPNCHSQTETFSGKNMGRCV